MPLGGRGSYNDMGGPVITTQVTIPKDVSIWRQCNLQALNLYQTDNTLVSDNIQTD